MIDAAAHIISAAIILLAYAAYGVQGIIGIIAICSLIHIGIFSLRAKGKKRRELFNRDIIHIPTITLNTEYKNLDKLPRN